MKGLRRAVVELILLATLVAAVYGHWQWQEWRRERDVTREREAAATELGRQLEAEASAVMSAFRAGIGPSVVAGRWSELDVATTSLLDLPRVAFAHVLRPDGTVLASSDAKLRADGNAREVAAWALGTTSPTLRTGEIEGLIEVAAPILSLTGPTAFLWLGYRADRAATAEAMGIRLAEPEASGR